jgi:hypothetical protein
MDSNPGRGKNVFSVNRDPLGAPSYRLFNWVPAFLPQGNKRPGLEFNLSLSPSAEVKNVWSWTFAPLVCLHGKDRNGITSTSIWTLKAPWLLCVAPARTVQKLCILRNNTTRYLFHVFLMKTEITPLKSNINYLAFIIETLCFLCGRIWTLCIFLADARFRKLCILPIHKTKILWQLLAIT